MATASNRNGAPGPHNAPQPFPLAPLLGLLLWILTIQNILWPYPPARIVSAGVLAMYLAISFPRISTGAKRISIVCGAVTLLLLISGSPVARVLDGVDLALTFAGFMPAIGLIRMIFRLSPSLSGLSSDIGEIAPRNRTRAALTVGYVFGAIMSIGSFAAIAPLYEKVVDKSERRAAGLNALRGSSLAMLWTPFTVAMGFTSTAFPDVPLWQVFLIGGAISCIALVFSFGKAGSGDIGAVLAVVRKLLPIILASAASLILANAVTGLSSLELIILLSPPACFSFLMLTVEDRRSALQQTVSSARQDLSAMSSEMTLFLSSITMGLVLSVNPAFLDFLQHSGLVALPAPVMYALIWIFMLASTLAGIHSTVLGPVVVAIYSGLEGVISPLAIVVLLLLGWSTATTLSVSSLAVALAARNFDLPIRDMSYGRNLLFMGALGACVCIGYTLIHRCGFY